MSKKQLVICQLGRVGDIVTSEPVYRTLRTLHADCHIVWYTRAHYVDLLRHSPWIDEIRTVKNPEEYLEAKRSFPPDTQVIELGSPVPRERELPPPEHRDHHPTPSLLARFCAEAGIPLPEFAPHFHRDPAAQPPVLPDGYAVFHCASQGKSRQWSAANWQALADQFLRAGIPVVEIGFEPLIASPDPGYTDLTECRDLQQLASVIAGARVFIGIESGFGHIAEALGTYGIILSGKLRNMDEYNFYAGEYRQGKNSSLISLYGVGVFDLDLALVSAVAQAWIDRAPLEGDACRVCCLRYQVRKMRRAWSFRIKEMLRLPLLRWRIAMNFHHRVRRR